MTLGGWATHGARQGRVEIVAGCDKATVGAAGGELELGLGLDWTLGMVAQRTLGR